MTLTPDDTAETIRLIKRQEGFSPIAYRDTEGKLTIGFGRLIEPPGGISIGEGEAMLANDIRACDTDLDGFPWYHDMSGPRKAAIVSMRYQLGAGGFREFRRMLAEIPLALASGDWERVAAECLNSKWHAQTPKRCEAIAAQFRTGSYP